MIYLDYNATTPLLPQVVDAMLPYLREHFGNPSSGHALGRVTKEAVERARAQVAALLHCHPDEVCFTSGGTEANNLAIRGVTEANPSRQTVITTVIEHPATSKPCAWLARHGYQIKRLPVDDTGCAILSPLSEWLSDDVALITVMHSNNETGSLQPIAEITSRAKEHKTLVHTDAAQSLGKVLIDVDALGVDLLSVAGHKLYAPKGVGALYVRRGTQLAPFALGAGHERGLRPGTENVASIVGLGEACEIASKDLEQSAQQVRSLRDLLWGLLRAEIPDLALHGHPEHRLPNTLNVRFPNASGSEILAASPGLAASTGSACHDGHESASAVILAMGVSPQDALGAVRLTLGRKTTREEIEEAARVLVKAWKAGREGVRA